MQTKYTTTRETIVTVEKPNGATKPSKGKFELIGDSPEFVIVDAIVPRPLGNLLKSVFDYYTP